MSDIHITRELLRAVASGELPPQVLSEIGWRHLMRLCPTCNEEVTAFQQERAAPANYDAASRVLPVVLERHAADLETKTGAARRDFLALLRLAPGERLHLMTHEDGEGIAPRWGSWGLWWQSSAQGTALGLWIRGPFHEA
jgi:hypothetical protein